eukprot:scaffold35523_cov53-Phaeocystis_antarctica.AAC.6
MSMPCSCAAALSASSAAWTLPLCASWAEAASTCSNGAAMLCCMLASRCSDAAAFASFCLISACSRSGDWRVRSRTSCQLRKSERRRASTMAVRRRGASARTPWEIGPPSRTVVMLGMFCHDGALGR